jgi:hypothetical protein
MGQAASLLFHLGIRQTAGRGNRGGVEPDRGEAERKLRIYAQIGVVYYVIFDPDKQLGAELLWIYRLHEGEYRQTPEGWFPLAELGVTLWQGVYEGMAQTWLRWCDRDGNVILTGAERAEQERQRAERLAGQLRALGIEPQSA